MKQEYLIIQEFIVVLIGEGVTVDQANSLVDAWNELAKKTSKRARPCYQPLGAVCHVGSVIERPTDFKTPSKPIHGVIIRGNYLVNYEKQIGFSMSHKTPYSFFKWLQSQGVESVLISLAKEKVEDLELAASRE